jgi:hypothetical protein
MQKKAQVLKIGDYIYVCTDEKIKKGDWMYYNIGGSIDVRIAIDDSTMPEYKKVIASTDSSLWRTIADSGRYRAYEGVDRIGQPFIEKYIKAYNAGKPITEIMVEYECSKNGIKRIGESCTMNNNCIYSNCQILKLHRDGSIITHPVEEKMYTREQFRHAVRQAWIMSNSMVKFEEWFNKNYPE